MLVMFPCHASLKRFMSNLFQLPSSQVMKLKLLVQHVPHVQPMAALTQDQHSSRLRIWCLLHLLNIKGTKIMKDIPYYVIVTLDDFFLCSVMLVVKQY
jgi:hypothetical protein